MNCHVLSILPLCKNQRWFISVSKWSLWKKISFLYYLSITENKYVQVFHVCMHGLWTRQMNFVKLQQNSFLYSISLFSLILLHLLSSFILKLRVLDANQVSKPSQNQAMKSKAKIMLDEFVFQWKRWCCSFLMVCNCNTAWCLEINHERGEGVKGKRKDYSTECAAVWERGGIKQRGWGGDGGDGGQTRQRTKMGNPLKVWEKICCLSVNGIGSPHG